MSSPAAAAAGGGSADAAAAAATPTTLRKPVRNFRHALTGLDPAAVLPAVAAYPCPMCDLPPFDSQRALNKHAALHQRAFDEEEVRTGKGAPAPTPKVKHTHSHRKGAGGGPARDTSPVHTLLDLFKHSADGAVPSRIKGRKSGAAAAAAAAGGNPRPRKKQVIRRGHSSESSDSEARSENEFIPDESPSFIPLAHPPPTKKRRKKTAPVEEEEDLSEEERRQSRLRHEQKKLNIARAAAGEDVAEAPVEGEEDVRCCLCHTADSDETNPIVMCDGPCDLPFHQDCFGIEHIPKGKWYCSTSCKSGRRIDRVEHLAAHRIRFQRRRRQMSNTHNSREQGLLKDFWESVEPYFDVRFLTLHGAELLRHTELTQQLVDIPALGRRYREVWREEDEEIRGTMANANSARSGRVTARNANEAAASPAASPLPAASPSPASPPAVPRIPGASPTPVAAWGADGGEEAETEVQGGDAEFFAQEGRERLQGFLQRDPRARPADADELARMESVASKPHTAAVTVLAMVGSTAIKIDPPKDETAPYDPDAREPFDRHSYYFPAAHHKQWTPPVLKRQESREEVVLSLEQAAEQVFAQATPAHAKFLTGADKRNNKQHKGHAGAHVSAAAAVSAPSAAAAADSNASQTADDQKSSAIKPFKIKIERDIVAALFGSSADDDSEAPSAAAAVASVPKDSASAAAKPTTKESQSAPTAAAAVASSTPSPSPSPLPSPTPSPIDSKSSTSAMSDVSESEMEDEADAPPASSAAAAAAAAASERESSPRKAGKKPRGPPAGKVPHSAASASSAAAAAAATSSGAHPVTGGKAPRAGATGGKAPRVKGKGADRKGADRKKLGGKKPKNRGLDDDDDGGDSAGGGSSDEGDEGSEDEEGMTLSEEEDLRAEEEDLEAEAEEEKAEVAQAHSEGHGLGAGKGPTAHIPAAGHSSLGLSGTGGGGSAAGGKHPAGKKPRGSGPVTSDRVFSFGPRLNDDVADEEMEAKVEPLEDSIVQLAPPFFDLRSLDLASWKETGIKLPRPRFIKLQHQSIVENFPFLGVVNPALLASSCHYSQPPLLYNSLSMQLVEMNMNVRAEDDDAQMADDRDQMESLVSIQHKLHALHAELDIVEVQPQQSLADLLPPPPPSQEELDAQAAAEAAAAEEKEAEAARAKEKADREAKSLYGTKFSTTASSRRSRGTGKADEVKSEGAAAAATTGAAGAAASPASADVIELDTAAGFSSKHLALPLNPSPVQLASLSIRPAYDDEVSAELWLLQRQYFSQVNHNNYVRSYLSQRAHDSGDWKLNLAQIEQKEKQDKDTLELNEESFLLSMARAQRESRRAKFELSEAGQIRNIKRWEATQLRNQRHIQRLMKQMLVEVERRDKRRQVDERRSASAAQRAAKRERRAALEAQWKTRKDQEIYRKCENSLDAIIKHIERTVEGKVPINHRRKDPNAPPRPRKKKKEGAADATELFCICRTPYDNDRFYLGCESCENWFHGKCVHITEEQAALIQDYICEACEKKTGRITTFVDNKLNRESRRMKQRRSDTEASSSESDESSLPSDDDSEEEPIRPLIIRRTKQGRKMHFQLVAHGDSDEEDEERADDEEEEEDEEDADMDEESDAEEAEDDVSKVRLRRLTSTTLRLQRLPDATPPDTKTRHALAVTLARYKFIGISSYSSLYVLAADGHPGREQTARQMLRRFRRRYNNYYPALITAQLARKDRITPSLPLGHRAKHVSAYTYRTTRFNVCRIDKENLVVSIRKKEMGSAVGTGIVAPVLMIECPLCGKACLGEVGIQRHFARVHVDAPKPDSAALREAQIQKNRAHAAALAAAPPGDAVAAPAAAAAVPASSHKRKRNSEAAAAAEAIKALATVAIKVEDKDEEQSDAAAAAARPSKRARASPSASPPPMPLALVAAAADATEAEAADESKSQGRRSTTPAGRRGAAKGSPLPDDSDDMSDVAEAQGSGSSARNRRGGAAASTTFTIRKNQGGDGAEVSETPRVVPFKLSALKNLAAEGTRKSPTPNSPSLTPQGGNKLKLSLPRGSGSSNASSPRESRRTANGTADDGGATVPAAAAAAASSNSSAKPSKRRRGDDAADPPAATAAAAAAAGSFTPQSKKLRGGRNAGASTPVPLFDAAAAAPIPDTLDIVKSRARQQVNKFAP